MLILRIAFLQCQFTISKYIFYFPHRGSTTPFIVVSCIGLGVLPLIEDPTLDVIITIINLLNCSSQIPQKNKNKNYELKMRWCIVLGILSHIGSPTLDIISRILQLDKSPSKKVQKCEQYFSYHHSSSRNINISSRGLSIFRSSNGRILIEFRITLFVHKQLSLLQQW